MSASDTASSSSASNGQDGKDVTAENRAQQGAGETSRSPMMDKENLFLEDRLNKLEEKTAMVDSLNEKLKQLAEMEARLNERDKAVSENTEKIKTLEDQLKASKNDLNKLKDMIEKRENLMSDEIKVLKEEVKAQEDLINQGSEMLKTVEEKMKTENSPQPRVEQTPNSMPEQMKVCDELMKDITQLKEKLEKQEKIVGEMFKKPEENVTIAGNLQEADKTLVKQFEKLEQRLNEQFQHEKYQELLKELKKQDETLDQDWKKKKQELSDMSKKLTKSLNAFSEKMQQELKQQQENVIKSLKDLSRKPEAQGVDDQCDKVKSSLNELEENISQSLTDEVENQHQRLMKPEEKQDWRGGVESSNYVKVVSREPRREEVGSKDKESTEVLLKNTNKRIDEMSVLVMKLLTNKQKMKSALEKFQIERQKLDDDIWNRVTDYHEQLLKVLQEGIGSSENNVLRKVEEMLEEQKADTRKTIDHELQQALAESGREMNEKDEEIRTEIYDKINEIEDNLVKFSKMEEKVKIKCNDLKSELKKQVTKQKEIKSSLQKSQDKHAEKMKQQISEFESQGKDREDKMMKDITEKLGHLKNDIVIGDVSTLNNVKQMAGEVKNECKQLASRLASFETNVTKAFKEDRDKLEKRLGEMESIREHREVKMTQDVELKVGTLKQEITRNGEIIMRNIEQLNYLNSCICQMNPRLELVEATQKRPPVGFTARTFGYELNLRSPIMKGFREVIYNDGGHYNAATGVFTAPRSGTYVASMTHTQSDEGEIYFVLVHSKAALADGKSTVAYTWTYGQHCSSSDSAVVKMESGDNLYIQIQHFSGSGHIWSPSSFSCFLIG